MAATPTPMDVLCAVMNARYAMEELREIAQSDGEWCERVHAALLRGKQEIETLKWVEDYLRTKLPRQPIATCSEIHL